jgi:hypothetical protein
MRGAHNDCDVRIVLGFVVYGVAIDVCGLMMPEACCLLAFVVNMKFQFWLLGLLEL